MENLTEKQGVIFNYIRDCIEQTGYPPTVREIAQQFKFKSPRAASDHLAAIERKGYINKDPGAARGLRLVERDDVRQPGEIPIVGDVAAGIPILAVENAIGSLSMNTSFGSGELFAVRVRGDSMIDHGIFEGDHVIVRRSPVIPDNTIAVAYIEGEATVKKIRKTKSGYELIPGNSNYTPICVTEETQGFSIAGPVVGVVRTL